MSDLTPQEQVEALARRWQGILQLRDWDVVVRVVRYHEMPGEGHCLGKCHPVADNKQALIQILDPNDTPYNPGFESGLEVTVVHELLHLHFEPFWQDDKALSLEQAINAIAKALVAASRSAEPKAPEHPEAVQA